MCCLIEGGRYFMTIKNDVKNPKILIVDDEKGMCFVLANLLEKENYDIITASNGGAGIDLAQREKPDAVIMDIRMPQIDGISAMNRMKEIDNVLPVILITAYGNIDSAVQAVKLGAYDYITKPFDNQKVIITLRNALTECKLKREINTFRSNLNNKISLTELMGPSDEIKRLVSQVNRVAPTNFTVVLYGETGSGKELVASAIHDLSPRSAFGFVEIDCGAIPETLIESEFFGYEKGAFTGAESKKEGYFELASKGSLLLDEIGNLPMLMQSKLLRALESFQIRRLGGKKCAKIDFRVIVANNERLGNLVSEGKFRNDLFHRLDEFTIEIPPLRKRKEDIIYLAKRFLDLTNKELNKKVEGFSEEAIDCLLNYDWPGNVRELKNVVRRAVLLANTTINLENLPIKNKNSNSGKYNAPANSDFKLEMIHEKGFSLKGIVKENVSQIEKKIIKDVLKLTGGNKSKSARILGIDNKTIIYKIKDYGIGLTIDN